ncbi:MAG: RNA methyltransferase, partial [Clostridia bacterium]|nr:RNA methyltransferase [Clostridia bacterium]
DIYNPKTLRAAMGAIFKIKTIKIRSAGEAIADLQKNGRKVLAAALDKDAKRLGDVPLSPSDVFLIGNEGHGLSNEAIAAADQSIFIPMAENTESLNAAVAASICLWEISKT